VTLRQAIIVDAQRLAIIHRSAIKIAMPQLPDLHTPAEDLGFYQNVVLRECDVWVVEDSDELAGFIALQPGWVDHLYVATDHQGKGIGSRLINHAKEAQDNLRLYTFQANTPARRFYDAHGFDIIEMTDGADNEESEPDVLYEWTKG